MGAAASVGTSENVCNALAFKGTSEEMLERMNHVSGP